MFLRSTKSWLLASAMLMPVSIMPLAQAQAQPVAASAAPAATDAATVDEVVVNKFKERLAEVKELEASNVTTVITATDLLKTPDENIAASLSRVAGISALNGGFGGQGNNNIGIAADLAGRGQAEYDTIRGMNGEYNTNTINGVNVAQGQAYSREVQFDLLPPTGLQTIVVNKSLTASMDGEAIGGSVDFQTPNAYDFTGRQYFSMSAGAKVEGRALDYDRNALGGNFSVAGAHKFGDHDQFGVYVAAYYDYRNFSNSIIDGLYPAEVNGMYTFAQQTASGASAPVKNYAQNLVLTGSDAGLTTGDEQRYGGNISLDWRPSGNLSAYLRMTYAEENIEQDTYNLQIYGNNISSSQIGTTGVYTPVIGNIQPRYYYETAPENDTLGTFQVGADWRSGALRLSPNIFASWGEDNEPNHIEFNGREPEVAAGAVYGGSTLFANSNGVPTPLVSAAEYANIANIGSYGLRRAGELSTSFSNQARAGAKIDGSYDVGQDWLKSVSFGVKYESSERNHTSRDYTADKVYTTDADDPTLASLPFISGSVKNLVPGSYNIAAPLVNQNALFKYFYASVAANGGLNAFSDICGGTFQDSYNCNTQRGIEAVSSTYIQGDLMLGGVQIIPGLRFEHTDISNSFYVLEDDAEGHFARNSTTYNKLLPSISANYRPNSLTVYRASIWTSYVKPSLFQLGGGEQVSHSDGGVQITEGNPNLKAMDAINYDASGEWRNTFGGYAVVGVFYKSLNHFIFDSVDAYTNATTQTTTQTTSPENGGGGHVYGLELTGRQKFTGMPAPFNGFGLSSNLTLERSGVHTNIAGLDSTERLQDQPNTAANAQLFYEAGPIQAQLSYRYTGEYVAGYSSLSTGTGLASSQLDTWVRPNTRLDLHVSYMTPANIRFDASVSNLLNDNSYYATIGKHTDTIPTIINSGRTFDFVARYAF